MTVGHGEIESELFTAKRKLADAASSMRSVIPERCETLLEGGRCGDYRHHSGPHTLVVATVFQVTPERDGRFVDGGSVSFKRDAEGNWQETARREPFDMRPPRLAVDAHGYVWRVFEDHWSMCPVNPDNSAIPEPVTFYESTDGR